MSNNNLARNITMLIIVIASCTNSMAQNIGIGTKQPDSNAILDIQSSSKGILIPRTSTASRLSIPAVKGLLLYDTTTNSFWFNNGNDWLETLSGNNPAYGTNKFDTSFNTAFGNNALANITSGAYNTGIGYNALYSNTTSYYNTALGAYALQLNTSGNNNTASGVVSLYANTTGFNNTANGKSVLQNNTTGSNNSGFGSNALFNNTSGSGNVAMGYLSSFTNAIAGENTTVGYQSGYTNTANYLVSVGSYSGYSNTTGSLNTFIGTSSGRTNSTGSNNTFVGINTGYSSTGSNNTFVGAEVGKNNTSGASNTSLGFKSSFTNTTANESTTIGFQSGFNNNANFLVAVGSFSGFNNNTGQLNTFIGTSAGRSNISGGRNTFLGTNAGFFTNGNNNTFLGTEAGKNNLFGFDNTSIGNASDFTEAGLNNATAIGSGATVSCSNCLALGGNTPPTRTRVGINNAMPLANLHIVQELSTYPHIGFRLEYAGGGFWQEYVNPATWLFFDKNAGEGPWVAFTSAGNVAQTSDERYKKNITLLGDDVLAKLLRLQPKKYLFKSQKETEEYNYGFIAQDVKQVFPEFVVERENGSLGVTYNQFAVIAVKAIQQQQMLIEDLQKENTAMKIKFQEMERRLSQLEQKQ